MACLILMTIFFLLAWFPGSKAKASTWGMDYVISNRDETGLPPLPAWGQRANRAYENLKSNFPAFAIAILALEMAGKHDRGIEIAAGIYVVSRLVHFVVYIAGMVMTRSTSWAVGLLANLYLLVRVCG